MAICDLCNAPAEADARRYSCTEFRSAVRAGLRPPSRLALLLGGALSREQVEAGWVEKVMSDTTDWILCGACATRAVNGKPAETRAPPQSPLAPTAGPAQASARPVPASRTGSGQNAVGTKSASASAREARPTGPELLRMACQECRKAFRVKPASAGKKVKCPHCRYLITVPGPVTPQSGTSGKPKKNAAASKRTDGLPAANEDRARIVNLIATMKAPAWKFWVTKKAKNRAAHELAQVGAGAIADLVRCLSGPGGAYAVIALRGIGEAALPACLTALHGAGRANACLVVSEIGQGQVGQVIQQFKGEGAAFALLALTKMGPCVIAPLIQTLQDSDSTMQMWAAMTLGEMGRRADAAIPALKAKWTDPDGAVREAATKALKQIEPLRINSSTPLSDLVRAFHLSPDRDEVVRASEELCRRGRAAVDALVECTGNAELQQRFQILKSVESMWNDEAARKMLEDMAQANLKKRFGG